MAQPAAVLPDDAPHLLVVDDDRRIRDLLSRFLFAEGYRVTTADNAKDARNFLIAMIDSREREHVLQLIARADLLRPVKT